VTIKLEDLDGATKTAIENLNGLLVPFSHHLIFANALQCEAQILEALDNSQPAQLRLGIEAKTAAGALFWFDEPPSPNSS